MFDTCANGHSLKCLTVVDEFTRACLAIDVAGSISSSWLIRSDNGPEFVSQAILEWLANQRIETALIGPGKPWQNADNESFNGKFRDECLLREQVLSAFTSNVVFANAISHE